MEDILDLRGLKCPLPALFARRALARAGAGETITVLADDPLAGIDIPHMCRQEGFEVLALERGGDQTQIVIRKPVAPPLVSN
jgi:tRNA 2-thiouridine synthesizing protein A